MAFCLLPSVHKFLLGSVKQGTPTVVKLQHARTTPGDKLARWCCKLGAPVSYLFVIPFVFWNVDEELGRSAMVLWALGMYLTSFAKDLLLLPQPHQLVDSVSKVYRGPASFGLPSVRSFSATAVPCWLCLHGTAQSQWSLALGAGLGLLWWCIISAAVMYVGAHSPAGVVVGSLLGLASVYTWHLVSGTVERHLTEPFRVLPLLQPLLLAALVLAYPVPYKWTGSFAAASSALGMAAGFLLGASWVPPFLLSCVLPGRFAITAAYDDASAWEAGSVLAPPIVMSCTGLVACWWHMLLRGIIGASTLVLIRTNLDDLIHKAVPSMRCFAPRFGPNLASIVQAVEMYDHSLQQCVPKNVRSSLMSSVELVDTVHWSSQDGHGHSHGHSHSHGHGSRGARRRGNTLGGTRSSRGSSSAGSSNGGSQHKHENGHGNGGGSSSSNSNNSSLNGETSGGGTKSRLQAWLKRRRSGVHSSDDDDDNDGIGSGYGGGASGGDGGGRSWLWCRGWRMASTVAQLRRFYSASDGCTIGAPLRCPDSTSIDRFAHEVPVAFASHFVMGFLSSTAVPGVLSAINTYVA